MKKTKIILHPDIIHPIRLRAVYKGIDIDTAVNRILFKFLQVPYKEVEDVAVDHNLSSPAMKVGFIKWCDENVVPGKKLFLDDLRAYLMKSNVYYSLITGRRFCGLLNEYAKMRYFELIKGKTNNRRWIIIYTPKTI